MANGYAVDDLLNFLAHASDKGLMPASTATALGVASRNVLGMLDPSEREDLRTLKIDPVIERFITKRAKDFNPSSLKEYGRRVHRAIELFLSWRGDPANFSVKKRATASPRKKDRPGQPERAAMSHEDENPPVTAPHDVGGYKSAIPIRPGTVVTVSNIPSDLTVAEAERLAKFVRMLAVD